MSLDEALKNKLLTLMGFAQRSGQLISGSYAVENALSKERVGLLLFSEECSPKTIQSLRHHHPVPYVVLCSSQQMSQKTGLENRHVFAVKKGQMAENMIKEIANWR